jgi:hypothetical protein
MKLTLYLVTIPTLIALDGHLEHLPSYSTALRALVWIIIAGNALMLYSGICEHAAQEPA